MVLGVCGGIAAYKAIEVCRRLVDAGAHVSPVLTGAATKFVGTLTFSALASEAARTSLWGNPEPIPHTRLGQNADMVVVVPATARLIGSYAAGISSDLLTATLLATRAPVLLAPAMHTEMWEHPAVVDNIALLTRRGVHLVGPEAGHLAGGDEGRGRLSEPIDIVAAAADILREETTPFRSLPGSSLRGLRSLVTAGGTREPIDPVRFIGNRSSGKQGHALAAELVRRGAYVTLVTSAELPVPEGVEVEHVETAAQMHAAVRRLAGAAGLIIMAAAVADFRPKMVATAKLKKVEGVPDVVLEATPDILAELGAARRPDQILVGFAAETLDIAADHPDDHPGGRSGGEHARQLRSFADAKLAAKKADVIVANDVVSPGVGFSHDTNAVLIVTADGTVVDVALTDKSTVASAVIDTAVAYGERRRSHPSTAEEQP